MWSTGSRETHEAGAMAFEGPSDAALDRLAGRFAIAFRVGGAVAVSVAAPIMATGGVSLGLLTLVLTALLAWSGAFTFLVVHRGLTAPLVVADAGVIAAVLLLHGRLVPIEAVTDGTTWVLMLASTAVFIPQLGLRPWASLPIALVVTVAYVAGAPVATGASYLVLQAVATSTLMVLVRRGGRSAGAVIVREMRTRQEARVQAERRTDEREQYRALHDTVLSTLTMVGSGVFDRESTTLPGRAAADLQVLDGLIARPRKPEQRLGSLREHLDRVIDDSGLSVERSISALTLPADVAERLADSVAEALRNVARHAGVDAATVRAEPYGQGVTVEVVDRGKGFEPGQVPAARRGISESIRGRMAAAGGSADVFSAPGSGTRVVLRWPDG